MSGSMTPRVRAPWQPEPVFETAAAWVLLQEQGDLSDTDQRRFAQWLAEDDSHADAYEDALWALNATSRHAGDPILMEMRRAALMARGSRRRLVGWVGAIGATAVAVTALLLTIGPGQEGVRPGAQPMIAAASSDPASRLYRTGVGERAAVALPDGSVATLDTDSQIQLAYSGQERGVRLLKGQALFEVAHGKPLPFRVYARGQSITAVGTVFNVRIEGERVRIAMVEGVVKVKAAVTRSTGANAPRVEVTLTAGEGALAEPEAPILVTPVEARDVTAWRAGQLVFNDVSLADAVAEINRYAERPIAISDAATGRYRLSGVFKSNDPQAFARAATEILPIRLVQGADGQVILSAQGD